MGVLNHSVNLSLHMKDCQWQGIPKREVFTGVKSSQVTLPSSQVHWHAKEVLEIPTVWQSWQSPNHDPVPATQILLLKCATAQSPANYALVWLKRFMHGSERERIETNNRTSK